MAADLTAYDAVLKEDYGPAIVDQMSDATVLLKRVQRNSESFEGKEVYVPLHTRRNEGIGARGENESLPTAGKQGYVAAKFPVVYNYGRVEISGPAIRASKNKRGSFVPILDAEVTGMANDFIRDVNRQLFGNKTGKLAACGTTTASTTVTLGGTNPTKFLNVDMIIDIIDTDDGSTVAGARTITAIDKAAGTITISGAAVTTDSTMIVVRSGSYNKELNGLQNIVGTATLHNVNPATAGNEFWKATVLANSGTNRSVSETLMQTAFDAAEEEGGKISLIVTTYGVRRAYLNLLTSLKRYAPNPMKLEGGFDALDYNGRPLVVDRDCPANKVYFLDESHLAIYQTGDPQWAELDGAILSRVSGKDAYEAYYYWDSEFGTDRRNVLSVLEDITEA